MTMYHAQEFKDVAIDERFIIPSGITVDNESAAYREYIKLNNTRYGVLCDDIIISDTPPDLLVWVIVKD